MTRPKFFLVIPRRHPVLASLLPPRNTLERAATAEAAGEEETAKGAEAISGAAVERDQGGRCWCSAQWSVEIDRGDGGIKRRRRRRRAGGW